MIRLVFRPTLSWIKVFFGKIKLKIELTEIKLIRNKAPD